MQCPVTGRHFEVSDRFRSHVSEKLAKLEEKDKSIAERAALRDGDWRAWTARVLADLHGVHPDLPQRLRRAELMRHGHAMAVLTCPYIRRIDRHVGPDLAATRMLLRSAAAQLSLG